MNFAKPLSSSISVVTPMELNTELPKTPLSSGMFNKKIVLTRVSYYELIYIFHIIFQATTLRTVNVKPSTIVIFIVLKAKIDGLRSWDGF
jgi:hypothetical protein